MAEKKMENKKVLVAGFHIVWATDHGPFKLVEFEEKNYPYPFYEE